MLIKREKRNVRNNHSVTHYWYSCIGILVLITFVVFVIYPKIKNSKGIDTLTENMTSDGRVEKTTGDLINSIKDAKDGLKQKSAQATQTIKDVAKDKKIIDKALGKDE